MADLKLIQGGGGSAASRTRELFAAAAIQGLLANEPFLNRISQAVNNDGKELQRLLAIFAVGQADALILQLTKESPYAHK